MPEILRNPAVEDYFSDVEFAGAQQNPGDFVDQYEDGLLINVSGFSLDLDFDFLNTVNYDVDVDPEVLRIFKKYPVSKILEVDEDSFRKGAELPRFATMAGAIARRCSRPIREYLDKSSVVRAERLFFEKVFEGKSEKFRYFQAQVRSGHQQILQLFRCLFPDYRVYDIAASWRFNETRFENLHWDNFADLEDYHQVRIFINLDHYPRIWHTSHRIEPYASEIYAAKRLAEHTAALHPNKFTSYINNKVLGGMANRCFDGLPRHIAKFDQGDVWLAETRIVSHQIFYGRRAVAYMFYVDPATMRDPERRFNRRIERLHEINNVAAE